MKKATVVCGDGKCITLLEVQPEEVKNENRRFPKRK